MSRASRRLGVGGGVDDVARAGPRVGETTGNQLHCVAAAEFVDLLSCGTPADLGLEVREPVRTFDFRNGRRMGIPDGKPGRCGGRSSGHEFPDLPMFTVEQGDVVVMRIENRSGESHPMHLNGHHALVLSRHGVAPTGSSSLVDSLDVATGESWKIAFLADNPRIWMDRCHTLPQAAEGIVADVMYAGCRPRRASAAAQAATPTRRPARQQVRGQPPRERLLAERRTAGRSIGRDRGDHGWYWADEVLRAGGLGRSGDRSDDVRTVRASHHRLVSIFTVRIDAESSRAGTATDLRAVADALVDFRGTVELHPWAVRWSVIVVVSAATIEQAGNDGVGLVVDAGNAVGLPSSEITRVEITSAADDCRRAVTRPAAHD